MAKLILGCGYLGHRVAQHWQAQGHEVHVLTRSENRAAKLKAAGLQPQVADLTDPDFELNVPPVESVLFAVGYDRGSGHSIGEVYVQGLSRAVQALSAPRFAASPVRRFIYISSTGVYSQSEDVWVDESSDCHPQREGGQACLAAEQLLAAHPLGEVAAVLRLAGIYGPGRVPRQRELQRGEPIAVPAGGYLNLIHVEDAVAAVLAAETRAQPPALYLVSDGHPVIRDEYVREVARQLSAPSPQFVEPGAESAAAARAASSKRVSNRQMLNDLEVQLQYPSYREGLAAILS